jgi:transcriptional regulator with XRE-family HTH domain
MSQIQISFGKRMRALREAKGISQEKLAELSDLDRTYISSVERGKRNISLLNIARLAKALNVPVRNLFE